MTFPYFIMFSSLVSETIPYHRDYQASLANERSAFKRVRSCFANFYGRCPCVYFYFVNFIFFIFSYAIFFPLQRSLHVLDELESLKPEFKRRLDKLNKPRVQAPLPEKNGFNTALQSPAYSSLEWSAVDKRHDSSMDFKQVRTMCYFL